MAKNAMAIDEKGNCYMIDEAVLKKHGKKIPKSRFNLGLAISKEPPDADVKGQDWFACSWNNSYSVHLNCGGSGS